MPTQSAPSPLFLLSGAGMVAVAVVAVWLWQRRTGPAWRFVWIGALAWAVGVALKFGWAIPTNKPVYAALKSLFGGLGSPIWWLYIGLLTGIFECGATWIFVRTTRVRNADQNQAVAFGLGFGGIEALLLGIVALWSSGSAILFFDHLPTDTKAKLAEHFLSLWHIPLPIIERISAIACHTVSCVLIVWSVQQRRAIWFWASFAYKTVIDGFAAWGIERFGVKTSIVHLAEFNLILVLYVGLSVIVLWRLRKRVAPSQAATTVGAGAT
jgi:uncharacterized membrane protein YhfC